MTSFSPFKLFAVRLSAAQTLAAACTAATILLTGCGLGSPAAPLATDVPMIKGAIHGGQQPIEGSYVVLYATDPAGTSYGAPATIIGTATSDAYSNFTITRVTGTTCPSGSQVYVTAAGGTSNFSPGSSNNSLLMMAALGDCKNLTTSTFTTINELTTVAAAYALSGFIKTVAEPTNSSLYAAYVGAPVANNSPVTSITSTAPAGLAHAFLNALSLVNPSVGLANATNSAGGTIPATELNTLGDILQGCINSGASTSSCSNLFNLTPSISGQSPTNTLQAFVNLARNPYPSAAAMSNSTGLLSLAPATGAFQPTLSTSPTDWSMVINYSGAAPYWLALDQNDTVLVGKSTGGLYGISAYGVSVPTFAAASAGTASRGVSPDALGNVWVCDNASAVDRFSTSTGSLLSTYATSGSCTPTAVDKLNNLWVGHVNSGSGSTVVDEAAYNSTAGTWALNYTVPAPAANYGPYGLSVDANQNIWAAAYYSSGTTEYVLSNLTPTATATYTSTGTAITPISATVGTKPYSTAIDASGNGWVAITGSNSTSTTGVQKVTPNTSATPTSLSAGTLVASTALNAAASQQIGMDGAGTIFIPDNNGSGTQGIHMYSTTSGNVLSPPTALRGTPDAVSTCTYTPGAGYTAAPTATITGGGGTGAAITLGISGTGAINSCAINSIGSGYVTAPTVTLSGGSPTTAGTVTLGVLSIYNPRQVVIDSTGSAWAGFTLGGVTQIIGVAAPTYPLLSIGKPGLSPGLTAANPLP